MDIGLWMDVEAHEKWKKEDTVTGDEMNGGQDSMAQYKSGVHVKDISELHINMITHSMNDSPHRNVCLSMGY